MLHIAGMPPVYDRWLNGVVPTWTSLKADRIDALRGMPPYVDGTIRLAFDLTDEEIGQSPTLQNACVLMRAAEEADGLELTARGNLTMETVSAMREAMDWPGCLFEEKWRDGKKLREGYVEELRLLRELVTMDSLLIRKDGRLRVGATGRRALTGPRKRLQASFFRELLLGGEPQPVRRTGVRLLAPAADRAGVVVSLDDRRPMAGCRNADAPERAAGRGVAAQSGLGCGGAVRAAPAAAVALVRPGRVPWRGRDAARPRDVAQDPPVRPVRAVRPRSGWDRASHGALTRPG